MLCAWGKISYLEMEYFPAFCYMLGFVKQDFVEAFVETFVEDFVEDFVEAFIEDFVEDFFKILLQTTRNFYFKAFSVKNGMGD